MASNLLSPKGKLLAAEGNRGRGRGAEGRKELQTLSGHSINVESVAWGPDRKRLVTASADKTDQVRYAMDIRDLMALARLRITADPSEEGCKKYLHVDKCPPFPPEL